MQPDVIPQKTRTHEQFMEDQIKFEQKRYENLKDIIVKEEESEMSMYRPSLSKATEKMAAKKRGDNTDVHSRLHAETKKEAKGDALAFKPQIDKKSAKLASSKRDKKIDEILTEDTQKRAERRKEMEKKFYEDQKLSKEETQKAVSKRSQKFIFKRLDSDWTHVLEENELEASAQVGQEKYTEIISHLGFATESASERTFIEQSWILLNGGK